MVQRILRVEIEARVDATDALAVALCHVQKASAAWPQAVPKGMNSKGRADARTLLGSRLSSAYRGPEALG
jgi:crossover junction endodeoxyribonuclease RuvC